MGGCRCTYRNCNVRSDGKTHMFHFPVFDKVRCHQWLVNAQKLDFLDLTVSQLKNKSICQHHFEAESFMNYRREKLTCNAVPTINGPFCDPSKASSGDTKKYLKPILVEDIENDFDTNDKKSNFSLKYADFLTNHGFVDSSARYNRSNINQTKDNDGINLNSNLHIKDKNKTSLEPNNIRLELLTKRKEKLAPKQMFVIPSYSNLSNELKMGKELNLEQNVTDSRYDLNLTDKYSKAKLISNSSSAQSVDIAPKSKQNLGVELNLKQNLTDPLLNLNLEDKNFKQVNMPVNTSIQSIESVDIPHKTKQVLVKTKPKIKILSEKIVKPTIKIGNIPSKFKILPPSRPLSLPHKKSEITPKILIGNKESNIKPSSQPEKLKLLEIPDVQFKPVTPKTGPVQSNQTKDKIENIAPQSPPKKTSQIKNKLTPERNAAIEKKRKLNMILKDTIEFCLDELDDPLKNYEISPSLINNLEKSPVNSGQEVIKSLVKNKTKIPAENVVSHLAGSKNLPNTQDYTIAYLEERMKKMENTLLNKIAQNSQVIDFKNTLVKDSFQVGKKYNKRVASTQTESESYKWFLYQEISKYLRPSLNSIICEELFVNNNIINKVDSPSKRQRRII